jgi:hypothetical protein
MKKKIFLLLVLCLCLFVGCGDNKKEEGAGIDNNNSIGEYQLNAKKAAYIDILVAFSKATVNKVNEGGKLQFFSEKYLYMVPVGEDGSSCVQVEYGGKSPFDAGWNYAYVGVVYTGTRYEYYVIGEDTKGNGIPFLQQRELNENGTNYLYLDGKEQNKELSTYLKSQYKITANDTHSLTSLEKTAFKEALKNNSQITTIVYVANANPCTYKQ